ncbi:indolepyruvate ferredoxin oxidoreductase family protein [Williamsia soli]|uniref:indolepyruvate ferredoxin oxidoreductase family protein n=1 Tax=Williamsia soli TaxID=364929 RepID=UPI001A9F3CEF|nr:indolepyruvate ferredoxin oxidoreductase family protein [Williamsia soli]
MKSSPFTTPRTAYRLQDRYDATAGEVLMTGVQAVCRVPLDVRRADAHRDLATRGLVTGYQGSPLGTVDFTMRDIAPLLDQWGVDFKPGMNEMLAATAVQGTQSVPDLGSDLQGVTGYWYGKTPGVDQALDAIRHGNLMGTSRHGGVLAFCGDDPSAKSSTVPGGSETVLRAALIPTLAAADPADVLHLGMHGVSMSRASGTWAALKIATNVADAYGIVPLSSEPFDPALPLVNGTPYDHKITTALAAASAVAAEQTFHQVRLPLVLEYARLNGLNAITARGDKDRVGIIAAGQAYAEVRQALANYGIRSARDYEVAGIRLLKLGLVWPLEPQIVTEFAAGLDEIVVVEEKGPYLELLVKDVLYNSDVRAAVVGSTDRNGKPLLPAFGGIDADGLGRAIEPILQSHSAVLQAPPNRERSSSPVRIPLTLTVASRTPYFCSGCPHNSSVKVPEGSLVGAGIGCHGMAASMDPEHVGRVTGFTQMGGEGSQWIGQNDYVHADHIFQNIGDGTLSHSGLLAIRASVAAGTNITYKILFNSTVAMTGGQDAIGGYNVPQLTETLAAEGVRRIYVTTEDLSRYRGKKLAKNATVKDRLESESIQAELSALPGTTVLIHDQACAAELRRMRKRGKAPTPTKRIVINESICEGCGDCGRKSNCLSVMPVDTEFGRKTQIHQASCNLDFSCLQGDCPSFMEVTPGKKAEHRQAPAISAGDVPEPQCSFTGDGFNIRLTGIGGTGIVTVAQIIGTAAFLDGFHTSGLDQTGLSQKAGPVVSDIKIQRSADLISPKISSADCDLFLCCDALVGSAPTNLAVISPQRTMAVINTAGVPTGAMIRRPNTALSDLDPVIAQIDSATRREDNPHLNSDRISQVLFGTNQFANMLLVGAAFQIGALPLSSESMERAIELNGVAVEKNIQAFRYGRKSIVDPAGVEALAEPRSTVTTGPAQLSADSTDLISLIDAPADDDLARVLASRVPDLIDYQSVRYARRYAKVVSAVRRSEQRVAPGRSALSVAVAESLYKLMAYKDEYEVARLALSPAEQAKIVAQFGEGAKVVWKLFPPMLREMGLRRKISLGRWFTPAYVVLRWAKFLRGTPLDLFGYSHVRKTERSLVEEYANSIDLLLAQLTSGNYELAVEIAQLPDMVRGYEQVKLDNVSTYRTTMSELSERYITGKTNAPAA